MEDTRFKLKHLAYLLFFTQYVRTFNLSSHDKYIVPLVLSVIFLFIGKEKTRLSDAYLLVPGVTYVTLGLVSCAAAGYWGYFSLKTGLLVLIPSLVAPVLYEKVLDRRMEICKILFLAFALYNCAFFSFSPFNIIVESNRALTFGLFVIFFFINKDWDYTVLAAFFCYISHKRITLLGVVCVLCFIILAQALMKHRLADKRKIYAVTAVISLPAAYLLAYLTYSGGLIQLFDMINVYAMGRAVIWEVFRDFAEFDIRFTGRGLGFVLTKLDQLRVFMREGAWFGNLHSDFFAGYLELGFIGYGVWIYSYFRSFRKFTQNAEEDDRPFLFALAAILYTFVMFLTDNVLIYIEYWLPLNIMLLDMVNRVPSYQKKQAMLMESQRHQF